MKRTYWNVGLAGLGIVAVGCYLLDVLTDNIHLAAIDASLVAIIALILLARAANR